MMGWTLLFKGGHTGISTTTIFNAKDASSKAILWEKKYNIPLLDSSAFGYGI